MQALVHGAVRLPPLSRLLGIRPAHIGPGSGTYTMGASAWLQAGGGALDVTALIESALTGIAMTTVAAGVDVVPVSLVINYFRPTRPQAGNLLARGRVVNVSRFFIFAEVEIEDPHGRQIAHGVCNTRIHSVHPEPPNPPPHRSVIEEPSYATPDPFLRPVSGADLALGAWQENDGVTLLRSYSDAYTAQPRAAPSQLLFGFRFTEIDEGRVVAVAPASDWLCCYTPTVTPGIIAMFGNGAGWGAALSLLKPGESLMALEQTVHFHRPVRADGRLLRIEAQWSNRPERDLILIDIIVCDGDGIVVATQRGTGAIIKASARQKRAATESKRVLTTLLFTDIVDSTSQAQKLGDARWRALMDEHRTIVRTELQRGEGVEIDTTGDGFLIRFESAAQAIHCARAIRDALKPLGLAIRAGIHTGECEARGRELVGLTVHVAARIQAAAAPNQMLVSAIVKELAAGAGIQFEDVGDYTLKGVAGRWRLYAL